VARGSAAQLGRFVTSAAALGGSPSGNAGGGTGNNSGGGLRSDVSDNSLDSIGDTDDCCGTAMYMPLL